MHWLINEKKSNNDEKERQKKRQQETEERGYCAKDSVDDAGRAAGLFVPTRQLRVEAEEEAVEQVRRVVHAVHLEAAGGRKDVAHRNAQFVRGDVRTIAELVLREQVLGVIIKNK